MDALPPRHDGVRARGEVDNVNSTDAKVEG